MQPLDTANIVYIADPEVLAIPIEECKEPMIDARQYDDLWYGPPPECPETAPHYTKMRISVYEKVLAAQRNLPNGLRFRLYEGYRCRSVQKMLFDTMRTLMKTRHPDYDDASLFHETTRLVSPVINFDGSENVPVHNTGGAVDIEIVDLQGQLLNFGMSAADWMAVEPERCLTHCPDLSAEIKENRALLCEVMAEQNFVNYPTEWWHFSHGDRYWAYLTQNPIAIYGAQ